MRYFTRGQSGHYSTHALLTNKEIANIIKYQYNTNLFCSVQEYDNDGIEVSSQLVFDIDYKDDIRKAYYIAIDIINEVYRRYNAVAELWFSGSKGFHVITGLQTLGNSGNVSLKGLALSINANIDKSMYKTRSLFRLPNTLNTKSGLHKTKVYPDDTLNTLLKRAEVRQADVSNILLDPNNSKFNADLKSYTQVVTHTTHTVSPTANWLSSIPVCIKRILESGVPEGYRWDFSFHLLKHMRLHGVSLDDAIDIAESLPVFSDGNYTEAMIRHYYNHEALSANCDYSGISDLLHDYCSESCPLNQDTADDITGNMEVILERT
jgi:hypothetical protein